MWRENTMQQFVFILISLLFFFSSPFFGFAYDLDACIFVCLFLSFSMRVRVYASARWIALHRGMQKKPHKLY